MDLNILESRTGRIIGDPVEAHKELNGEFTQWFGDLNDDGDGCTRAIVSRVTRKAMRRFCRTQTIPGCLMT